MNTVRYCVDADGGHDLHLSCMFAIQMHIAEIMAYHNVSRLITRIDVIIHSLSDFLNTSRMKLFFLYVRTGSSSPSTVRSLVYPPRLSFPRISQHQIPRIEHMKLKTYSLGRAESTGQRTLR